MDREKEGTKHRTEWCAEINKYRCMRCGKSSKKCKDARKMHKTIILVKKCWKMREGVTLEVKIWFGRMETRRGSDLVQKVLGICEAKGPKWMNCCKLEQVGTKEYGKMLKRIQVLEGWQGSGKGGKKLEDRRTK